MNWIVPEWLVALSLTLFVVDIFLMTEFLSWGGVLSLAIWLTWRIDAPWKWSILIFLASFTSFAFLYVFLLRNTVGAMVRNMIQKNAPKEAMHAIVGKVGTIRIIDGRGFAYVDAELWPISQACDCTLNDGMAIKVVAIDGGEIFVGR